MAEWYNLYENWKQISNKAWSPSHFLDSLHINHTNLRWFSIARLIISKFLQDFKVLKFNRTFFRQIFVRHSSTLNILDFSPCSKFCKEYLSYGLPCWLISKESTKQEMQFQSLGQEDPLDKEKATHSSFLAWEISWTEELGGIQSMRQLMSSYSWLLL